MSEKDSCGAHTLKKDGLDHGAKYVFIGLKGQGKDTEPDWTREVVAVKRGESALLGETIGMLCGFCILVINDSVPLIFKFSMPGVTPPFMNQNLHSICNHCFISKPAGFSV